jgi:phage replication initiation protein
MDDRDEVLRVLVDWLQFTVKNMTLTQVFELIGIPESEFTDLPKGLYFYTKQKICGDIRVLYEGNNGADMGIHVQMSGQGCREFESFYNGDWYALWANILNNRGQIARFDIAVDEFRYNGQRPFWTVPQLIRKTKKGETRSKWKNLRRMESIRIANGQSEGHTAYFGSAMSDIQLRCYEKNKERENAGKEIEEQLTTWNRAELQLSDDRAQDAITAILKGDLGGEVFFRLVKNYINFTDKVPGDTNKSRWPISQWWTDYLGGVDKLQIARQAPDKTIEAKKEWINRQVNPSMAEIWYANGSPGPDMFWTMIRDGLDRMSEAQWARADNYLLQREREEGEHKERRKKRREQQLEYQKQQLEQHRMEVAAAYGIDWTQQKEPLVTALVNDPLV